MFQMDLSDTYAWPVEVAVVNEKGTRTKMGFTAQFKRMPQSDIDRVLERAGQDDITDQELVNEIVAGWKGIREGKDEVEFNASNLAAICEITPTRMRILEAWAESISEGVRKN